MPKNQSCLIWKPWIIRLSVRTHSMRRVLDSLQNPGACSAQHSVLSTFHNPQIYKELFLQELSSQRRPWVEWLAERDDGMLQSLDLHDSRSAMITFLGRSKRDGLGPANDASLPMMAGAEITKCVNIFRVSEWVNCVQVWLHWQDFCWGRVGPEPVNLS